MVPEKTALLETSQFQNANAHFELLRRTLVLTNFALFRFAIRKTSPASLLVLFPNTTHFVLPCVGSPNRQKGSHPSAPCKQKKTPQGVFFVWRRRWDSNPRYREVQLISSQSRYDHFDTSPYMLNSFQSVNQNIKL